MKVLVVGGDYHIERMFYSRGYEVTTNVADNDIDLVCFTGGEDVSPSLYGEKNIQSFCNPARDRKEQWVYEQFLGKVPMCGICRGGQLLNVLNGGSMIQHINGHGRDHLAWDGDMNPFKVVSTHHQGIVRDPNKSISLLVANHDGSPEKWKDMVGITEACIYPETKALCFQPHPEWGDETTEKLFFEYLALL